MGGDTPGPGPGGRASGRHGGDPTLASYLSSLLYLLSVPGLIALAYGGYWLGYWDYGAVLPVFGGGMLALVVLAFAVMHVATGR